MGLTHYQVQAVEVLGGVGVDHLAGADLHPRSHEDFRGRVVVAAVQRKPCLGPLPTFDF